MITRHEFIMLEASINGGTNYVFLLSLAQQKEVCLELTRRGCMKDLKDGSFAPTKLGELYHTAYTRWYVRRAA